MVTDCKDEACARVNKRETYAHLVYQLLLKHCQWVQHRLLQTSLRAVPSQVEGATPSPKTTDSGLNTGTFERQAIYKPEHSSADLVL